MVQLRTNLFAEYSKQIQLLEEKKDLDKAVELMNDYIINLAIYFIGKTKKPSYTSRFLTFSSRKNPTPAEYIQKWKTDYQIWFKSNKPMHPQIYENKRAKDYRQMKNTFNMLHNLSFSSDNIPERQIFVIVDPNTIKFRDPSPRKRKKRNRRNHP
jgi:hypothetical protein